MPSYDQNVDPNAAPLAPAAVVVAPQAQQPGPATAMPPAPVARPAILGDRNLNEGGVDPATLQLVNTLPPPPSTPTQSVPDYAAVFLHFLLQPPLPPNDDTFPNERFSDIYIPLPYTGRRGSIEERGAYEDDNLFDPPTPLSSPFKGPMSLGKRARPAYFDDDEDDTDSEEDEFSFLAFREARFKRRRLEFGVSSALDIADPASGLDTFLSAPPVRLAPAPDFSAGLLEFPRLAATARLAASSDASDNTLVKSGENNHADSEANSDSDREEDEDATASDNTADDNTAVRDDD